MDFDSLEYKWLFGF